MPRATTAQAFRAWRVDTKVIAMMRLSRVSVNALSMVLTHWRYHTDKLNLIPKDIQDRPCCDMAHE